MVSPHTRDNGLVDIADVLGVNCGHAVDVGAGFVAVDETGTPGSYAAVTISNVHAVYGSTAQLKSKHFGWMPCALRDQIITDGWATGIHKGPAIVNTLYDADPYDTGGNEPGDFPITISGLTHEGFDHQFKLLVNDDDEINPCNAVPVTGLAVSPTNVSVTVGGTGQLTSTAAPANATDPSVTWSSDNTAVATVSSSGLITGINEGTTTITATANDGGYTDTCTVTVSGFGTPGESANLTPIHDSFVYSGAKADNNFGSQTVLDIKDNTGDFIREIYLRFDLSAVVGGSVTNAKLRLKAESGNPGDTHSVHVVSNDSWDESVMTWNTKPAAGSGLDSAAFPAVGSWIELDVTSQVNTERDGDGLVSLALISSGTELNGYYSKEAAAEADWPELVIETGDTDSWSGYVDHFSLSNTPDADNDSDGQDDILEYALGGDATNLSVTGTTPHISSSGATASFFHEQRTNSNPGITYIAEWTQNLVNGPWTNAWDAAFSGASTNTGFEEAEYQIDWGTKTSLFFRLRVTQP